MSSDTDFIEQPPADSCGSTPYDPLATTTPEGCPSPLGWAQVLEAYRSQSTSWSIRSGGELVEGRTFGSGQPLYFLNGLTGTSDLFCLLVWLLRDEFRCVLFDYPTCPDAAGLADTLFAIADAQHDATFSFFATSFGGIVGLNALLTQPARIERAILQGAFAQRRLSATERLLCRAGRFLPGAVAGVPFRNTIQLANHQRSFPPFDHTRWGFFTENTGRTPIRDVARRAAIAGSSDYRPRLAEIHQPVLLVRSEHEGHVLAECSEELASGLPNATTELLHSTGPLAHLTHPHRLAKLVRAFLLPHPVDQCHAH